MAKKKTVKKVAKRRKPPKPVVRVDDDTFFDYFAGSALEGIARSVGIPPTNKMKDAFCDEVAVAAHDYAVEMQEVLSNWDEPESYPRIAFLSGRALAGICTRVGVPRFGIDGPKEVAQAAFDYAVTLLDVVDEDEEDGEEGGEP